MIDDNGNKEREPYRMRNYSRGDGSQNESEGFFCRFTFGQFFALLVLEVFTIFFIFYLGARYGRELLGFKEDGPIVVGEPKMQIASTDDPEISKLAKDIVEQAKTPELKERLSEMLARTPDAKKPNAQEETEATSPVETNEEVKPEETPETTTKTSDNEVANVHEKSAIRIKSSENAKYALQIGSYQQMSEANSIVEKWQNKGYPAYLMIADIPDRGRWYRVRLGGFATRDEAKWYKKEIEAEEGVETVVVLNEK